MIKIERITNIEFSKVVTLHTSPQLRACYLKVQE